MTIAANSSVQISVEFETVYMHIDEFPADPHNGFPVGGGIATLFATDEPVQRVYSDVVTAIMLPVLRYALQRYCVVQYSICIILWCHAKYITWREG